MTEIKKIKSEGLKMKGLILAMVFCVFSITAYGSNPRVAGGGYSTINISLDNSPDSLTVGDYVQVGGSLTVTDNASVGGTLGVTGAITSGAINASKDTKMGSVTVTSGTFSDSILVRSVGRVSQIYGQVGGNNILDLYGNNIKAYSFDHADNNYHTFKIYDISGIGGTVITGSTSTASNINSAVTIVGSCTVTNIPTIAGGTALYGAANGGLMYTSSTRAVKKNIVPIKVSSKDILKLEPVNFDFKADNSNDNGLIADDVEKVIPALCAYQDGKLSGVKYEKLAVYLLKVVKEQEARITKLEKQLKSK